MTNPYLDLLQAQPAGPGAAPEAPANPYLASLQSEEDQRQQALAGQLTQAVGVNPDQYNAKRRVAQYLGYPTAAVEALPQLEQQAKVQQTRQTIANAPTLQRKYTDADFAKLAHDDAPVLAQIEDFIGKATAYVMGATPSGGMGGALKRGVWDNSVVGTAGAFRMVSEVGAAAVEAVVPGVQAWEASGKLGGNPLRRLAEGFAKIGAAQQASKDAATPDAAGNFAAGVESGFESAGQNAKYLPLAFMGPPGWAAALTGMVVETGGLTYQKDREEGVPLGTATLHAGADMLAEYVGERYFGEVGFLKRLAAGAPASKLMMWELTREVPGEIGTTLWQNFNDWTLTNSSKPVSEFLREQPDAIAQTAIATLVGGTAQAGAGRIAVKSVEAVLNRQMEITSTLQREDALKELMAQAAQSKLAERSPEQLQAFVAEASGDATVRFDAATLVEVFRQDAAALSQALPSLDVQVMQEAVATGGEVTVPLAELVAGARAAGVEQTILEHARLGESTLSAAEARQVQGQLGAEMQAQVERVVSQAQDQEAARQSHEAVRTNLAAQISQTGRYRPQVAEQMATWAASFYTAYGSRLGVTAEEMFRRYPLRVLGAQGAGRQGLGQITPEQAKETNVPVQMPTAPEFTEALGNTPGARITADGLLIDLVRFQKPEQEGAQAVRTGVFYLPKGSPNAKHYKGGKMGYGGTETFAGPTLLRRPLFVKGATGGKAPEAAFIALKGKDAFKALDSAVMRVLSAGGYGGANRPARVQAIEEFIDQYAPDRSGYGSEIESVSRQGNTLRYALQELAVAYAVREAGHDAVVGYSKGKAGAAISEVFDVREQTFPARGMDSQVHDAFMQSAAPTVPQTETEAFKRWFGDSKVVDAEGKPLVVYHGTSAGGFDAFKPNVRKGEQLGFGIHFAVDQQFAELYANDPLVARKGKGKSPRVYATYLKAEKPLLADTVVVEGTPEFVLAKKLANGKLFTVKDESGKQAAFLQNAIDATSPQRAEKLIREAGYDAVRYQSRVGTAGVGARVTAKSQSWVVFSPEQIKSAIGNDGTFDANDPSILSQGPTAPRGTFNPETLELVLNPNANLSTWFHETGHFFLEVLADVASQPGAPAQIVEDMNTFLKWAGITGDEAVGEAGSGAPLEQRRVAASAVPTGSVSPITRKPIFELLDAEGQRIGLTHSYATADEALAKFNAPKDPAPSPAPTYTLPEPELPPRSNWKQAKGQKFTNLDEDDGYLYHVTAAPRAAGIRENGLVPGNDSTFGGSYAGYSAGKVFLTERSGVSFWKNKVEQMLFHNSDNPPAAVVMRIPKDKVTVPLTPDDVGTEDARARAYYSTQTLFQGGAAPEAPPIQPKRTPLETWNAMTLDQKRPYHERWAESVEQYVMEGRAPSVELQPMMRRFAAWLKSVYGSIKQFLAGRGQVSGQGGESLAQMPAPEGVLTGENGKPLVLYHGSPTRKAGRKFDAAKSGQRTDQGNLGSGVYLTPAEFIARAYANNTGDVEGFYVANGKVLTFVYDENYKANIEALATQLGVDAPAEWGRVGQTNLEWSKQFAEKARAAGYVATGGVNSDGSFAEMVVYDPANLKPVSGKPLAQDPNAPAGPDLQLNDDIRRVMDRMLATDEQIAQANEVAGLMPDENADAEAQERLRKRSIADLKWAVKARDKALAKLRKSAKGIEKSIRADVEAEVEQMPEVLAAAALSEGKAPEVVADAFGYPSVEAMHRAIDAFGSPRDAIDGMTERRMLEEHGDLIDDRAIEAAANEAVHNEARARSLATELRTQREMLNTRADTGETNARGAKVTVNALVEAAKQFGANVVSRTPIRDLKSKAWQHTAAERRASKRWAEATAAGKTADAVKAKQDQMLNHAAAKAALDAETEATKIREFFARVAKGNDEETVKKGRDADIVNAARAVLAEFGVETATTKRADDYLDAVKTNDPETWNAIEPMVREATQNAQPLDALTFDELQGLNEQIHALWFLAKRSRQMEVDGDLIDIGEAAQDIFTRLEEIGIPDTIPGEVGALTKAEERARWLQFAGALLRRVEQWTEKMDGKFGGPFNRLLFQPIKDAATRYRADHIAYRAKFQALVDQVAPSMTHTLIEAPELGYTFGRGHNGIGHAELLHAILHTGNDSNKRKLLLGRRWATENADGTLDTSKWDAFINRLANAGVLQQAHFDFAQGVWDLMESTKPLAQKTHRDVFGRYFAEVTANPFVDPFGVTRSGGYVPAQADPTIVTDASLRALTEMENESMAFSFPATSKGFTKSRVEYNRPLKLDLRTLPQHIDKVLLFSHMEPAVRGAAKLLRQKKVSQPLNRIDPAAYEGMLLPWLNRSARQQVETPIVGDGRTAKILSTLRSRAGAALMFANVSNTVQQITGVVSAGVKVAPSQLLRAAVGYVQHPQQMTRAVTEASEFMRVRMDNSVQALDDEVKAILTKPNLYERAQDWTQRHAYFLQQAFDNVLSPIVWTGAYNDALAQGMDERMAIRFADGTVRQTQGALAAEDVSRIETGPAYARMFTQFISYFNMMANTNLTALQQINREMGIPARAARASAIVTLGFLLPIWIAEAIAVGFKGGPGDADGDGDADTLVDWLAAVLGMGTIKGLLAQVPFVGTLANSAVARFNGNPADDKMSLSPAVSMLEAAAGVPSDLYKIAKGEGNARTTVRDVASLLTLATGLPLTAAARPLGYAAGVADDRIAPTGPADAARGALTGVPSPASKVQ